MHRLVGALAVRKLNGQFFSRMEAHMMLKPRLSGLRLATRLELLSSPLSTFTKTFTHTKYVSRQWSVINRYNQAPHLPRTPHWKLTKSNKTSHTREPRGLAFPSRWPQGYNEKSRETRIMNNQKWSTKEAPPVSKNSFTGGLKLVSRRQLRPLFWCGPGHIRESHKTQENTTPRQPRGNPFQVYWVSFIWHWQRVQNQSRLLMMWSGSSLFAFVCPLKETEKERHPTFITWTWGPFTCKVMKVH